LTKNKEETQRGVAIMSEVLRKLARMLTIALILFTKIHAFKQQENSTGKIDILLVRDIISEIYEIRIYENAPPGTKATLNEAFDKVLRELKNCFAQLDRFVL
jgi:hypothetical protein